jgi:CBS-domain-containing membrane protein
MADNQVRRLPVVDKRGQLKGVVSMNDLVLQAKATRGKEVAPTYAEVVRALKQTCQHRQL